MAGDLIDVDTRTRRANLKRELAEIDAKRRKEQRARRPKSPKADRGRVRDNAYLAWLRRQPCAICRVTPSDAAHIRTPKPGELPTGLQRKPDDRRATPLCRVHHEMQHGMNEMRFWRAFCLDPFEVASRHYAEFLRGE